VYFFYENGRIKVLNNHNLSLLPLKIMNKQITHNRQEETLEAKARWFQSLSLTERAELLDSYTDMILEVNPGIPEQI
jgi:hypothetical protein